MREIRGFFFQIRLKKIPGLVSFWANLTPFGPKSGDPGFEQVRAEMCELAVSARSDGSSSFSFFCQFAGFTWNRYLFHRVFTLSSALRNHAWCEDMNYEIAESFQ